VRGGALALAGWVYVSFFGGIDDRDVPAHSLGREAGKPFRYPLIIPLINVILPGRRDTFGRIVSAVVCFLTIISV
jgi:hypothetical protein